MPADPSVYGLLREQKPLPGPLDQYGTLLNLRHLMTQNALGELQSRHLAGNIGEEEALRSKLSSLAPGETLESAMPELRRIAPLKSLELEQRLLQQKKLTGDITKQDLDAQALKAKDARDTLAGVKDQPSWDEWLQYAKGKGYQVAANAPAQFDPNWQQQHLMTADQFIGNLEHQKNRDVTLAGQAETARANKVKEFHAGLSLAETKRHHAALEGDPQMIEDTAQAIATGKLAPLSGFALARPSAQNIMARVVQINPDFDPTQFQTRQKAEKDFATGKQGNTVRSFNVALAHLDTLDQLSDALNNKDMQLINKIGNTWTQQTGGAAPTNFEAAKKIVADEIVKAIVGSGGGVGDREAAAKTVDAANSPAQLKGVIKTYKELMRGQIGGLRQQYESTTGKTDFDTKYLSESGRQTAHTPAAQPAKPSDRLAPAKGAVQDGYRFKGGDPAKPENWEKV
jgi:hypothetical protein